MHTLRRRRARVQLCCSLSCHLHIRKLHTKTEIRGLCARRRVNGRGRNYSSSASSSSSSSSCRVLSSARNRGRASWASRVTRLVTRVHDRIRDLFCDFHACTRVMHTRWEKETVDLAEFSFGYGQKQIVRSTRIFGWERERGREIRSIYSGNRDTCSLISERGFSWIDDFLLSVHGSECEAPLLWIT